MSMSNVNETITIENTLSMSHCNFIFIAAPWEISNEYYLCLECNSNITKLEIKTQRQKASLQ